MSDIANLDIFGSNDGPSGNRSSSSARRMFVQKVYSILAIAMTITLANGLLSLVFMSRYASDEVSDTDLGSVIYLSIGLTFFFWCSISYISLRTELDFTVHKLFIWSIELIWLFIFVGIWMFSKYRQLLVLWATLGMVIVMMELAVDTQMVSGGLKNEFSVEQYLVAPMNLYWDIMLLFLLTLPVMGAIISSLLQLMDNFDT